MTGRSREAFSGDPSSNHHQGENCPFFLKNFLLRDTDDMADLSDPKIDQGLSSRILGLRNDLTRI